MDQPMIEVPSNWGGNREGAGAGKKPFSEKKSQLYVMVQNSSIEKLGGKDKVKKLMLNAIETALSHDVQV